MKEIHSSNVFLQGAKRHKYFHIDNMLRQASVQKPDEISDIHRVFECSRIRSTVVIGNNRVRKKVSRLNKRWK